MFSAVPTPHIIIEVCRIRSRFESEAPSLLMMTRSYLLSWDDILTLLDIHWTFWAPCWDPADSYVEVLDCKSFSPHYLSGTLYASNITLYEIIRLQWWPLTSSASNQGMLLWIICTQANAIYANIILPKIVPINFTPIAHQYGAKSDLWLYAHIWSRKPIYLRNRHNIWLYLAIYLWKAICCIWSCLFNLPFAGWSAYTPIFVKAQCWTLQLIIYKEY